LRVQHLLQGVMASLLLPLAAAAHEDVATLTLLEGQATLIRGTHGYVPAEGIKLKHADILHTGKNGLLQLETDDGAVVELGPGTRYLADLPGARGHAGQQVALGGWIKFTVPKRQDAAPYRLDTPHLSLLVGTGISVVQILAAESSIFMESGEGTVLEPSGRAAVQVTVRPGRFYVRKVGQKGTLAERPSQAFIEAMPTAFRDTLPRRLAKFKGREVSPRPGPEFTYADVEGWLKGDREVRRVLVPIWRAKADDPSFHAALVANMRFHWEWDPILFPEKYKPKEEQESTGPPARQAGQ
jgi:hypothetical protein